MLRSHLLLLFIAHSWHAHVVLHGSRQAHKHAREGLGVDDDAHCISTNILFVGLLPLGKDLRCHDSVFHFVLDVGDNADCNHALVLLGFDSLKSSEPLINGLQRSLRQLREELLFPLFLLLL